MKKRRNARSIPMANQNWPSRKFSAGTMPFTGSGLFRFVISTPPVHRKSSKANSDGARDSRLSMPLSIAHGNGIKNFRAATKIEVVSYSKLWALIWRAQAGSLHSPEFNRRQDDARKRPLANQRAHIPNIVCR